MTKKRYGKVEKKILEILEYNHNIEYSLQSIVKEIFNDTSTNSVKYNTVRNAIDRLEKNKLIQSKVVPVFEGLINGNRGPSKMKMIRISLNNKQWKCEKGIKFIDGKIEEKLQLYCNL